MIDEELRALLHEKADAFDIDSSLPAGVPKRARGRATRRIVAAAALVLAAPGILFLVRPDRPPVQDVDGNLPAPAVQLVTYMRDDPDPQGDPAAPDPSEEADARRFADCMRERGFEVPDPVHTHLGWTVMVAPSSIDESSPEWRKAAFVSCRPLRELSGDLVLSDRTEAEIEAFTSCLRAQGYELPAPRRTTPGQYVFDLQGLDIDFAADAWHRAVLVTCAPAST
jgi:hypothetical protein